MISGFRSSVRIPSVLFAERVALTMTVNRPDASTFVLEGSATIYEVSALRAVFGEALARATDLRVDLGESGKWDIAGLQLLISLVNTGRGLGKTVQLARPPKNCIEVAQRSGLSDWLSSVCE
jgi:ABC-type transporter Mla MlaB component